jgi:glyoxylase-like metal-dependent hydrolase (beta-lactamase superfamily II)
VVDAGSTKKLRRLMAALGDAGVLPPPKGSDQVCALVVATHPHDDHIEGLAEIVETYGNEGVGDFWEPGYFAPTR